MLKIILLVPILLCLLWTGYLKANNWTLAQGKKGYIYIMILSGVIAAFFTLMLYLTHL